MEPEKSNHAEEDSSEIFDIPKDRFTCVTVDTKSVFSNDDDFERKLTASMKHWKRVGIRGVWVKIALQHSSVVPVCAKVGFEFHHAHSDYLMMKKWLSATEKDCLPVYANQYLGCGGFVVNEKGQVLVIKEKYHTSSARWKFPGGHADLGEDIADAAKREVLEETGIKCEFVCILTFRHQHNFRWKCSDFYFICLMKALSTEIKPCPSEIAACQWMDVEEYVGHNVTDQNRYAALCFLRMRESPDPSHVMSATHVLNHNKTQKQEVYSVQEVNVNTRVLSPNKETAL